MDAEEQIVESESPMLRLKRLGRWIVDASGLVRVCCFEGIFLALALFMAAVLGIIDPLAPTGPSEAQYIAWYMYHFDKHQIEKIDYIFEGGRRRRRDGREDSIQRTCDDLWAGGFRNVRSRQDGERACRD